MRTTRVSRGELGQKSVPKESSHSSTEGTTGIEGEVAGISCTQQDCDKGMYVSNCTQVRLLEEEIIESNGDVTTEAKP